MDSWQEAWMKSLKELWLVTHDLSLFNCFGKVNMLLVCRNKNNKGMWIDVVSDFLKERQQNFLVLKKQNGTCDPGKTLGDGIQCLTKGFNENWSLSGKENPLKSNLIIQRKWHTFLITVSFVNIKNTLKLKLFCE